MSVLDLDFYKLTMLQFIWKHYANIPVIFQLHSRKQNLREMLYSRLLEAELSVYNSTGLTKAEHEYLKNLGIFDQEFVDDLSWLFYNGLPHADISDESVSVAGKWFEVSLWETIVLSRVSEQHSGEHTEPPSLFKQAHDIIRIGESGAWWADFGTRRRYSQRYHERLIAAVRAEDNRKTGFIGTSNVDLAMRFDCTPIGTYAHELEMVLRPYFNNEFDTTRDVLTKWQEMYPWRLRVALTDTYTTPRFIHDHGEFLMDNQWRGIRLDSGDPKATGYFVDGWLAKNRSSSCKLFDVVFSDGLDADTIVALQNSFGQNNGHPATFIQPVFGWGTGLTNPNSDLSLVMKAVESRGEQTYKITDDAEKSIR